MRLKSLVMALVLLGCLLTSWSTSVYAAPVATQNLKNVHVDLSVQKGVNGNPWGYDFVFTRNHFIYSPPRNFCGYYFHCIKNFWAGRGYIIECYDGMYSKSGGIRGACSYHRGGWRILYWH